MGDIERLEDNEYIREILETRSKARHQEASRLYQAEMRWKEEVAKNAYKEGQSIEFISKITGISIGELKQILV